MSTPTPGSPAARVLAVLERVGLPRYVRELAPMAGLSELDTLYALYELEQTGRARPLMWATAGYDPQRLTPQGREGAARRRGGSRSCPASLRPAAGPASPSASRRPRGQP